MKTMLVSKWVRTRYQGRLQPVTQNVVQLSPSRLSVACLVLGLGATFGCANEDSDAAARRDDASTGSQTSTDGGATPTRTRDAGFAQRDDMVGDAGSGAAADDAEVDDAEVDDADAEDGNAELDDSDEEAGDASVPTPAERTPDASSTASPSDGGAPAEAIHSDSATDIEPLQPIELVDLGHAEADLATGVALDPEGNFLIAGGTIVLSGENRGAADAALIKVDARGQEVWTRVWGTDLHDTAAAVVTDADGNAYVVGSWEAPPLPVGGEGGNAFLAKYSPDGEQLWMRQVGGDLSDGYAALTWDANGDLVAVGATSGTTVEPSGGPRDVLVTKFTSDGDELWTRQFGTDDTDLGHGIAADADGILIAGGTRGGLGRAAPSDGTLDSFVARLNDNGDIQWVRQWGSSKDDEAYGIAIDQTAGTMYVTGYVFDQLTPSTTDFGDRDLYVSRMDSSGNPLWDQQYGTSDRDEGYAVAIDAEGNALVTGYTYGDLGETNQGESDALLARINPSGELLRAQLVGREYDDSAYGVVVDGSGRVFIVGFLMTYPDPNTRDPSPFLAGFD